MRSPHTGTRDPDEGTAPPTLAGAIGLTITPSENGPLLMSGSLEVVSGTGRTINRCGKTALCRCGGSANKPYCDGTHKTNGFRAS